MLLRLLLLFTLVPLAEFWILFRLAEHTSFWTTVAIVLATGVVGASLARWQGLRVVGRIQQDLAAGQMPADSMLDGLLILVAAAVLVTPGLLTDTFGFLLLIPPARNIFKRWLVRRFRNRIEIHTAGFGDSDRPPARDQIIEGKVIEPEDDH